MLSIREKLGYSDSETFIGPEQLNRLPANELVFALRRAATKCESMPSDSGQARFDGAYVLQREPQSPAVPVVYLVSVGSEAAARRVHQIVWNQNQTPFLIVESPSTVRVYAGFSFNGQQDESLLNVVKGTADLLEKLAAFRAESIDDGTLWKQWAHAVDPSKRVSETLLRDLKTLDQRLQTQVGMDRAASHGLIGKFVYLNYLRHRGILSDKKLTKWEINPDHLFSRNATLKAFHRVNDELQDWLNGSVFSLGEEAVAKITAEQLKLVARVFAGDSPIGMNEIQLSLFSSYDFSHIPIETLSCVYEQFLHDVKPDGGSSRGKMLGAYYTPLPLADYVLSEMDRRRPLTPGMTVLDPACGSGAFLVQCYRRLIERRLSIPGAKLRAVELRDLLTEHIFGIDRDEDACRVAELSLIMTLLDYIEPPDLEHTNFKLPSLRDRNIVEGDFFDQTGPAHKLLSERNFDWIVGNPPWSEVKKTPAPDHEHFFAHQWMLTHKKTHPTSGNQIAEAFLWKTGEHLAKDGICSLVVLAMTWFKKEGTTFRKRFFSERRVWCLANFANLAYVLFAGRSERPASVVFFEDETPDEDHLILTFAPFVAEQVANRPEKPNSRLDTWNIIGRGAEIREIEQASAIQGDSLTWKIAMWGTSRDKKLLERVRFRNDSFEGFAKTNNLIAHEGFRLQTLGKTYSRPLIEVPELLGKLRVIPSKLRNMKELFAFPEAALEQIPAEECYVPKGRAALAIKASSPPHILVDAARRFAVFSNAFIAIPAPNISIAGPRNTERLMQALSLFLSSKFCIYHQFFYSHQWGVDASRSELSVIRELPTPLSKLSDSELDEWSSLQQQLEARSRSWSETDDELHQFGFTDDSLINELDERAFNLLGLKPVERWLVEDFVRFHLELNKGKVTAEAVRSPTGNERFEYLLALRSCLDGFLPSERGLRHKLEILVEREYALFSVSLGKSNRAIEPVIVNTDDPDSRNLKIIRDRLRAKHSQWVYFDRTLRVYDPKNSTLYQLKPLQRVHWTRRQAVVDSDDIIAETLSVGGVS